MPQRRFENYLLEDEIGRDVFGVVHDARHLERPQSLVLRLLVPPPEFGPFLPSLRGRFRVEAPMLARLEHRNTAQILESGVQGEELYLIGAPAGGRSLREVIDAEGPLAEARVRRIAVQVLESLREAHNLGLPHGSLTPDDIFIDTEDTDRVIVRHHGLAWLLRPDGLEAENELPQLQGKVLGAPQYAAPERFRAGPSFAADVYAVGLVMWEMLTGEPAVDATEPSECLEAHLGPEPWELPATLMIAPELRDLVHKALQRHPRKRFVDAERMLEALDGAQPASTHALGLQEDSMIDPNVDSSQPADFLAFGLPDDLLGHTDSESLAELDAFAPSEPVEDSEPSAPAPSRNFAPRPRELTPIELDEGVLADQRATVRARERTHGADAPPPVAKSRRSRENQCRILFRARGLTTTCSQSRDGPAPSTLEVTTSTVSPELSSLCSGTRRPFTLAPMQVCPTSVWTV